MNKRKLKKIILYMILLLIICIIVIVIITNINKKKEYSEKKYEAKLGYYEEYYEEKVFPSGVYQLSCLYEQADGELDLNLYYKKLYRYTRFLSELYNQNIIDKNESEIKQYFELNNKIIKNDIGIVEYEDFNDTINKLKQYKQKNITLGEYKRASINIQTLGIDENYCIFDTIIDYTEGKESIIVKTFISKHSKNPDVCFKIKEFTSN